MLFRPRQRKAPPSRKNERADPGSHHTAREDTPSGSPPDANGIGNTLVHAGRGRRAGRNRPASAPRTSSTQSYSNCPTTTTSMPKPLNLPAKLTPNISPPAQGAPDSRSANAGSSVWCPAHPLPLSPLRAGRIGWHHRSHGPVVAGFPGHRSLGGAAGGAVVEVAGGGGDLLVGYSQDPLCLGWLRGALERASRRCPEMRPVPHCVPQRQAARRLQSPGSSGDRRGAGHGDRQVPEPSGLLGIDGVRAHAAVIHGGVWG